MRIARLGTAFLFAIGSYGLSTLNVAAAPMPNNVAADPGPGTSLGTVPAPRWRAGSTWEYSDGYGVRVRDNQDGVTTFERLDAPGQWFSMRGFLRQDAASSANERQTIYRTVAPGFGDSLTAASPLTFRREYLSNGKLVVHASSWTVEGRERITVPAGTFDCWIIVWRERSLRSNWTGFERWWYSPETQQYVRMEYKYGDQEPASRVLMRYRLAPGVAGDVRPSAPAITAPSVSPVRAVPVDAVKLDTVPVLPAPDMPMHAPDPMLVPLSRKDPEPRLPPQLKEVPAGVTRLSPVFVAPMSRVAIDEPPAPQLKLVPVTFTRMTPMFVAPMSEIEMEEEDSAPALIAFADVAPVPETIDAMAMAQIEMETALPPLREIATPLVAMGAIEAPPMADVAMEPLPASEMAMLWPTDRIDNLRRRVMPYYDPDAFMPSAVIPPEPAVGSGAELGFFKRVFRAVARIFE